jgi:excisionase family DNA binding protein
MEQYHGKGSWERPERSPKEVKQTMTTMTRRYNRRPVLLDEGDIDTAAQAARELRGALDAQPASPEVVHLLVTDGDEHREAVLPAAVAQLLADMLTELARGNAVSLVPLNAELTTQQAADLLGVSRPYLVDLLDQGAMPYRRVGNRRRVPVAELLAYRARSDAESRGAADELTRQADELGMGYED